METKYFVVTGRNLNVIDHVRVKFDSQEFQLWHLQGDQVMIGAADEYFLCRPAREDYESKGADHAVWENGKDSYGIKTIISMSTEGANKFYFQIDQNGYVSSYLGEKVLPQKF